MKQILSTFLFTLFMCVIHAQEFSMFLYLEDRDGNKDSIEVGFDTLATSDYNIDWYGTQFFVNDVLKQSETNKMWGWIIDIPHNIFYRKKIVPKPAPLQPIWDTEINAIDILIPVSRLPVTIKWDIIKFATCGFPNSSLTDAATYDAGYGDESFLWENPISDLDSIIISEVENNNSTVYTINEENYMKHLKFFFADQTTWNWSNLENISDTQNRYYKIMYNGILYISINDKFYNMMGIETEIP